MIFADRVLLCKSCRNRFLYTVHEQRQHWAQHHAQTVPDRCPGCVALKALTVRRMGTVKWFDRRKGYGFIEGDDCGKVFVHRTALGPGLRMRTGARVAFDLVETDRGRQALEVTAQSD